MIAHITVRDLRCPLSRNMSGVAPKRSGPGACPALAVTAGRPGPARAAASGGTSFRRSVWPPRLFARATPAARAGHGGLLILALSGQVRGRTLRRPTRWRGRKPGWQSPDKGVFWRTRTACGVAFRMLSSTISTRLHTHGDGKERGRGTARMGGRLKQGTKTPRRCRRGILHGANRH